MTIVDFLRARWDEGEAKAKLAMTEDLRTGQWTQDGGSIYDDHPHNEVVDWVYGEAWAHIAANDPAFVLADIAAKRAILDEYEKSAARTVAHGAPSNTEVRTGALADVVQLLAQPYAGHEDWKEEWKV